MRGVTRSGTDVTFPSNRLLAVTKSCRIIISHNHPWHSPRVLRASPSGTVEAAVQKRSRTRRSSSPPSDPAAAAGSPSKPSASNPKKGSQPLDDTQISGDQHSGHQLKKTFLWLLSGPGLDPPGLSFELPTKGLKNATDHAAQELESRGVQLPPIVPVPYRNRMPRPLPEGYSLAFLPRSSFTAGILCGQPREVPEGWTLESLLALPLEEREAVWERSQQADPAAATGTEATPDGRVWARNWLLTGPGLEPLGVALHVELRTRRWAVREAYRQLAARGVRLPSPSPGCGEVAEEEAQLLQLGYSLQPIIHTALTLRVLRGKAVKLPDDWTLEALLALPLEDREATYQQIRPRRGPPKKLRWRLTGPKLGRDGVVITLTESYARRWFFAQLAALRELADRGVVLSAAAKAVLADGRWPATWKARYRSYLPDRYKLFPIDEDGYPIPKKDQRSDVREAIRAAWLLTGPGLEADGLILKLPPEQRTEEGALEAAWAALRQRGWEVPADGGPLPEGFELRPGASNQRRVSTAVRKRRRAEGLSPRLPLGFTEKEVLALPEEEREALMRMHYQKSGLGKRATHPGVPASSRFAGVAWDNSRQLWQARTYCNGKTQRLGRFSSEMEAAQAYDRERVALHNARLSATDIDKLNFPEEWREDFEGKAVHVGGGVMWRQIVRQ